MAFLPALQTTNYVLITSFCSQKQTNFACQWSVDYLLSIMCDWEVTSTTRASCFIRVSKRLETIKALGLRPRAFISFSVFGYLDETLALVVDILLSTLRYFARKVWKRVICLQFSWFMALHPANWKLAPTQWIQKSRWRVKRPSHVKLMLANSCWQTQIGVCERHNNRVGKLLARIETSSICRQQFANVLLCRSHTPILSLPTRVGQH